MGRGWGATGGGAAGQAHHAVLRVQHVGIPVVPLEERPVQPQALHVVILDHRPQLLVVSEENHLEGQIGVALLPQTQRHPTAAATLPPLALRTLPRSQGLAPHLRRQHLPGAPGWHRLTFSAPGNRTRGMRVSGSVAMPASSTRTCRTLRPLRLAAAAHEQVQSTTLWRPSSCFRAFARTFLYLRGEAIRHPGTPTPGGSSGVRPLTKQAPHRRESPLSVAEHRKP